MPFTNLVNAHECDLPNERPDGSSLSVGDEWRCDTLIPTDNSVNPPLRDCGRRWRWTTDQRDGDYWERLVGAM